METVKQKTEKAYDVMKKQFGYTNVMSSPKVTKIIIASGTGSGIKRDKNRNTFIMERIGKISGQKPSTKQAKKSVASFKVRQGDPIGVMVTLRGTRMQAFLDKLINVALPRTKDFRGIDQKIVDSIGNLTMPIKEHTIFPETADEELKDVFGLAITIVTTAKSRDEALEFFKHIGIPFKK
ncbi:50S ribosomal protein L5 [Candidatus Nomurabacteria bacterium]|jgi:large subunit ribosomal protein L5|nr:MAG: 50S ribosomal protein L5 [Candidatus Nomurabacteria bacterium]